MSPQWYFVRAAMIAIASIAIMAAPNHRAAAQRFQNVHGGANIEAGRGGVTQLAGGGYAAVGETFSTPSGTSDIYVVVTNVNGGVVWSNRYNVLWFDGIDRNDSATNVIQCANGDLALCGVYNGPNGGRDGFVLRLNSATGAIVASGTYDLGGQEIFYDLVEATAGNGVGTLPGDLIAVGSTTVDPSFGPRNGLITRFNAACVLIWDANYRSTPSFDECFYGVEEAQVPFGGGGVGDIIAVGYSTTWGVGGGDIYVVRVNGNNGTFGPVPQGAAVFGGVGYDEALSVAEVRLGAFTGDLVIGGRSFSAPLPSTNSEAFILQLTANVTAPQRAALMFGDNGAGPDAAMDAKLDPLSAGPLQDIIVTGYTNLGFPVLLGANVYLQKVIQSGPLFGGGMAYGAEGTDWGWSVNIAQRQTPLETQGYVVAGFTQSGSLIGADPQQLYLIRTDNLLSSGCNETTINFAQSTPNFLQTVVTPTAGIFNINAIGSLNAPPVPLTNYQQLCYALPQARQGGNGGNDGVAGVSAVEIAGGTVTSYPNPLAVGEPLNLRFTMAADAVADVAVSDVVGRVISEQRLGLERGNTLRSLDTRGWPAGVYLVRITIDGSACTVRLVVGDR